jgi:hypothetical protein
MTTLISSNKYGNLHKLKNPYKLLLKNTKTPFGIQETYNKKIIHWYIQNIDDLKLIRHFQEDLQQNILKDYTLFINNKVTQKGNYNPIIETNVSNNIESSECISHIDGEIVTYNSIIKGTEGDVTLICDNIVILENKVNMIWNIVKIVRSSITKKTQSL